MYTGVYSVSQNVGINVSLVAEPDLSSNVVPQLKLRRHARLKKRVDDAWYVRMTWSVFDMYAQIVGFRNEG